MRFNKGDTLIFNHNGENSHYKILLVFDQQLLVDKRDRNNNSAGTQYLNIEQLSKRIGISWRHKPIKPQSHLPEDLFTL